MSYPKIFDDPKIGQEATKLFNDAQEMLKQIIAEKWLTARAVTGFFPANSTNSDDIVVYQDEFRNKERVTLHHLRQQTIRPPGKPNRCLSDFVASVDSGKKDYIGGFVVTVGIGIDEHIKRFEQDHDDYQSILLKALADRLAEAFAEHMHDRVRHKDFCTEAGDWTPRNGLINKNFNHKNLITEEYPGIRPAPGYPACPDHTEKPVLWQLLEAEKNAGVELTESMAMLPTASVSGWYFSNPESSYFGVGQINKDQVEDYAKRKNMSLEDAERWLAPVLGY
jgi:5-methyltetrahydrofolate--homocysteine methyltransferase